ncbi:MAG: hypothetical protein COB39_05250 [Marinosulfonomonas sp.]|nr:MAG: hypothetical protein COB39_05250 [Marinosulfonomonas sp.]
MFGFTGFVLELIFLLIALYFAYSHFSLKKTVSKLQHRIYTLESEPLHPASVAEAATGKAKIATKEAVAKTGPWKPPLAAKATKKKDADGPEPDAEDLPAHVAKYPVPKSFVFTPERLAALTAWIKENWFYAIAALSLALSGVFFVQYGIENGYLTPFWRVMGALGLGAAMIVAGEWIRRKSGDGGDSHTAYLPSVFSGAGLVALFAGVLAARQMYGLIGAEMALVGLVAVSALAVVLGWFYGPLLAAVGIIGATTAPFLVGGSSESGWLFYYYFALIAVTGMLVDAIKRWAWVSALALVFTFIAAWFTFYLGAGGVHFLGFALIGAIGAAMIPPLQIWPHHAGEMVSVSLARFGGRKPESPEFPTRLATGAFAAATIVTVLVSLKASSATEVWLVLVTLAVLLGMAVIWFGRAPALRDTIILPPLAFLFVLFSQSELIGNLYLAFKSGRHRLPEAAPPWDVTVIVAMALVGAALIFWRGLREKEYRLVWAGGVALFAPLTVALIEIWWVPVSVLGKGLWAWHAMAVAIVMTLFAVQVARMDGEDRRRAAIFALSAMTMISFALMVMLSSAALTLAIAVMVLLAAAIDRQLDLKLLSVFVQIGGVVVGYRLVADPGVFWAYDAPIIEFVLAYGGVIALFAATWFLLKTRARKAAIVVMESAVWTLSGIFVSVALLRTFADADNSHALVGAFALIWLISAANQLYRLKFGGRMRWVRMGLAAVFGVVGLLAMAAGLTVVNPLFARYEEVQGPLVLDTLMVAYLLPALLFGFVALRFDHLHRWLRIALGAIAVGVSALYVGLEIRRFWQGDVLAHSGTTGGELYSYTIAMLLVSVALLFFAFSKRSDLIRKAAIVGIGLTIAKVFLIDMSGLTGLIRVASFLGLGLSLAGLAWVNRQMMLQWDQGGDDPDPAVEIDAGGELSEGDAKDDPEADPKD